jgi:hypothetical protein
MPGKDPHALFRKRRLLEEAGLLSEAEEAVMQEHAEACASCREAREDDSSGREREHDEGHIPSAVLARWERARASVGELERGLWDSHLAACESCRRDLALAGGVAGAPAEVRGEEFQDPEPGPARAPIPFDPRRRRRAWLQGGLAGAALAAAAALILQLPAGEEDTGVLPWVVPATIRGSAPAIEIAPGTRRLLLAIPVPPGVSPEGPVGLTLEDPSGAVRLDLDIEPARFESPTLMVVLSSSSPLEPGLYTVRLVLAGEDEPRQSTFRVVVSGR